MNKRQNINEYYIGETPGVREIYNCIHVLRTKYKITEKKITPLFIDDGINCSPEMIKLNRAVEKEFGFNPFSLYITPKRTVDAFTYRFPGNHLLNPPYKKQILYKNKKGGGLSYDPADHNGCLITLYYGLFFNPKFTDREITAIILHEVGHNFSVYANKTIGNLNIVASFFQIIYTIINTIKGNFGAATLILVRNNKWTMNGIANIVNLIYKTPILSNVVMAFGQIFNLNLSFIQDIKFTTNLISLYPKIIPAIMKRIIENLITFPCQIRAYEDENFSDSFAVMYGYGEDLATGLNKMASESMVNMTGYSYSIINEIPIIGHLLQLYILPYSLILGLFDEHPDPHVRVNQIIVQLRQELKESKLDPKTRKEIESQIYNIEINVEKYNKRIKGYDPRIIQGIFLSLMYHTTSGDGIKTKIIDKLTGYNFSSEMKDTMNNLKFRDN